MTRVRREIVSGSCPATCTCVSCVELSEFSYQNITLIPRKNMTSYLGLDDSILLKILFGELGSKVLVWIKVIYYFTDTVMYLDVP